MFKSKNEISEIFEDIFLLSFQWLPGTIYDTETINEGFCCNLISGAWGKYLYKQLWMVLYTAKKV